MSNSLPQTIGIDISKATLDAHAHPAGTDRQFANTAKGHKPGLTVLGLKEGGVGYAMDTHNASLVTADMKKKLEAAKADIISGKIKVADYMADNACKY